MRTQAVEKRFYVQPQKESRNILILSLAAVLTFMYGAGLRDRTIGIIFMALPLVYVLLIPLAILQRRKDLNYVDVNNEEMVITNLGIFRKHVRWAEVKSVGSVTLNGAESIGFNFLPEYERHGYNKAVSMRISGHELLIRQYRSNDGEKLIDWVNANIVKSLPKTRGRATTAGKIVKEEPVKIKQSYSFADIWSRPYFIGWFGLSLASDVIARMLWSHSHLAGSLFRLAGTIFFALAVVSTIRYLRVGKETEAKKNSHQTNGTDDWSAPF